MERTTLITFAIPTADLDIAEKTGEEWPEAVRRLVGDGTAELYTHEEVEF